MTKYSVKVNDPARPQGDDIEVSGLGVFKNGSTRQVSDEDVANFRAVNAYQVDTEDSFDGEGDNRANTGAGAVETKLGPTPLQAFKDHPVVTVSEYKDEPVKPAAKSTAADKKE